jgi:hypothetical protein
MGRVPRRQAAILIGQSVPPPLLEVHSKRLKLPPQVSNRSKITIVIKIIFFFRPHVSFAHTVEEVIWKREAEIKNSSMEDGEEFIRNVLEVTNGILLSFTGWLEIPNEIDKFTNTSTIFRLVFVT